MGLRLGDANISLDTRDAAANINFVSHAHSDHTSGVCKSKGLISSRITKELIEVRSKKSIDNHIELEGVKLLDAGHILGSKQLYAEADGFSFIYSGDFQMLPSKVAEPIETRRADVLVIDATYPDKRLRFDDKEEVTTAIQHYLSSKLERGIVVFGAYTLGKAQELVKIANEAGIAPVVGNKIGRVNQVYERHGTKLDYISMDDETGFEDAVSGNFFGIVSMSEVGPMKARLSRVYDRKVYTGIASGFAKVFHLGTDVQFCLSDHADYAQSVEYIDACAPRLVYTYGKGASPAIMASNLDKEGYNAHPFSLKELEIMACIRQKTVQ